MRAGEFNRYHQHLLTDGKYLNASKNYDFDLTKMMSSENMLGYINAFTNYLLGPITSSCIPRYGGLDMPHVQWEFAGAWEKFCPDATYNSYGSR